MQFWSATSDVDDGWPVLGDPGADAFCRHLIHHLGAPRSGIDVTVGASLVALAADVDLQRLEARSVQCEVVLLKSFLELIHAKKV